MNAAFTMSTYQSEFEAKLSGYQFNFKLMEDVCKWIQLWKSAFEEYGIALHRSQLVSNGSSSGGFYAKSMNAMNQNSAVLPPMVLEYARLENILCLPEICTHEEAVVVLTNQPEQGRHRVTCVQLVELMKKWMSTFHDLGDRRVPMTDILCNVRKAMTTEHEDAGRSMETCDDVLKWMNAFVYVFELKDGLMSDMILDKVQRIYKGMSNEKLEGYSRKIFGCSCDMWMRYCVCVHSWAHMIVVKVL
jgi:hypothetical protein